jgi:hypothetical protein
VHTYPAHLVQEVTMNSNIARSYFSNEKIVKKSVSFLSELNMSFIYDECKQKQAKSMLFRNSESKM